MTNVALWLEADYFDTFQCKCGTCRHTCCTGWEIDVSMRDYYHLIGMECSEELHRRIEGAFRTPEEPDEARFQMISPNYLGRCPMLNDAGLCMLHLERGEADLPAVCRLYPRSVRREGNVRRACCSNSCEAVIEGLMGQDRLTLVRRERDLEIGIAEDDPGIDLTHTYRAIEGMQNRAAPIAERIWHICKGEGCPLPSGAAPSPREALRTVMEALGTLRSLSKSLREVGGDAFLRYTGDGGYDRYLADVHSFEAARPDWQRIFENVLVNHILYMDFPWADPRLTPAQACPGLAAAYGAMRIICAAHTRNDPGDACLADALSGIFHIIEHGAFYYNAHILLPDPAPALLL